MSHATRPLLGAAVLLVAGACAAVPPGPPAMPPDAEGVRAALLRDEAARRTIRGLARLRYDGPAGGGSADQVVVVALPDRARLETLSPVGTVALVLVLRGEELRVHAVVRREFGVGRATRETLGRLIRLPIPPEPLLRLLAGLPPLPLRPGDPRFTLTPEGPGVRVESVDGPLWQRLWTVPGGTAVAHGELGEAAGPLARFQFDDRRPVAGGMVPFQLRLEELGSGTRVLLRYEQLRIGDPLEDALFELPRPTDGETRFVDLGGLLPAGP